MVRLMRPATPVAIEKGSAIGMKVGRLLGIDRKSKALRYNEADLNKALGYSRYPSSYHAPTSPQLRPNFAPTSQDSSSVPARLVSSRYPSIFQSCSLLDRVDAGNEDLSL